MREVLNEFGFYVCQSLQYLKLIIIIIIKKSLEKTMQCTQLLAVKLNRCLNNLCSFLCSVYHAWAMVFASTYMSIIFTEL